MSGDGESKCLKMHIVRVMISFYLFIYDRKVTVTVLETEEMQIKGGKEKGERKKEKQ